MDLFDTDSSTEGQLQHAVQNFAHEASQVIEDGAGRPALVQLWTEALGYLEVVKDAYPGMSDAIEYEIIHGALDEIEEALDAPEVN
jgi:hypothetical protein